MRQVIAIKLEDEEKFLAKHPHWTVERRTEDDHGIAWLSFRIDRAAERKEALPRLMIERALGGCYKRMPAPIYIEREVQTLASWKAIFSHETSNIG